MSFLVCHPGRYGDLFWALPTIRALAEYHGEPARLLLPADSMDGTPMQAVVPLLEQQEYIGRVDVEAGWHITHDAPRKPRYPPSVEMGPMQALGYTDWPKRPLPYEIAALAGTDVSNLAVGKPEVFFRPWITAEPMGLGLASGVPRVAVHWTDRWFELKLGITKELQRNLVYDCAIDWYAGPGSRMAGAGATSVDFLALARVLAGYKIVLTDCSAAHVLAAAVGVRTVLVVEPEPDRHHFIFWPGSALPGWTPMGTPLGARIKPVLGTDGAPTFDSRHTIDEIGKALEGV